MVVRCREGQPVKLFKFFTDLAKSADEEELSILILLKSFMQSLWVFLGSVTVGVTTALVFSKLTKHVKPPEAPIFELLMFLVFAYSSFFGYGSKTVTMPSCWRRSNLQLARSSVRFRTT